MGRGGINATVGSLLGFLHEGPQSGWDLVNTAQQTIGDFWSLTRSQVYRELVGMAERGLIEADEVGPRDRRPYRLTDHGRQAFGAWIAQEPGDEQIRYPLLLTLVFGRHVDPARLAGFLSRHRAVHADRLEGYRHEHAAARAEGATARDLVTLDFGLRYEAAVLDWFDHLPHDLTGPGSEPAGDRGGVDPVHYVIVPGIGNSEPDHWQSIWEAEWGPSASRVLVGSWDAPDLGDWCRALDLAAHRSRATGLVLVAHSLGCLAVAAWLSAVRPAVRGVFLVSPPDRRSASFPAAAPTFAAVEPRPLGVPGLVVASADDPYCSVAAAAHLAAGWGLPLVRLGRLGHVNVASGIGRWDTGRDLLTAFSAGLDRGR